MKEGRLTCGCLSDGAGQGISAALALVSALLCAAGLFLTVTAAAGADEVVLTNGQVYENCEVETREDGFVVVHEEHREIVLDPAFVEKVTKDAEAWAEYAARVEALAPDDAEGQFQLALFCKANGLWLKYRQHLEKTIEADPAHAAARRALGHKLIGGQWLDEQEQRRFEREREAKERGGLVFWKGQWVPAEQAAAERDAEAAAERLKVTVEQRRRAQGLVQIEGRWVPRGANEEGRNLLAGRLYYEGTWGPLEDCLRKHAEKIGLVETPHGWLERSTAGHLSWIRNGGTIERDKVIAPHELVERLRTREGRFPYREWWLTPGEQSAVERLVDAANPSRSHAALGLLAFVVCAAGAVTFLILAREVRAIRKRLFPRSRLSRSVRATARAETGLKWRIAAAAGCWLIILLGVAWFLSGGRRHVGRARHLVASGRFDKALEACRAALRWRAGLFDPLTADAWTVACKVCVAAGGEYLDAGHIGQALASLRVARVIAPPDHPMAEAARSAMVRCRLAEASQARQSRSWEEWEQILAATPVSAPEERKAWLAERTAGYQEWASVALAQGRDEEAASRLLLVAVLAPEGSNMAKEALDAREALLVKCALSRSEVLKPGAAFELLVACATRLSDAERRNTIMDALRPLLGDAAVEQLSGGPPRLAALAWMLYLSGSGSAETLRERTQRFVEAVGERSDTEWLRAFHDALPPDGQLAFIVKKQIGSLFIAQGRQLLTVGRIDDAADAFERSLQFYDSLEVRRQIAEGCIAIARRLNARGTPGYAEEACSASLKFYDSPELRRAIREVSPGVHSELAAGFLDVGAGHVRGAGFRAQEPAPDAASRDAIEAALAEIRAGRTRTIRQPAAAGSAASGLVTVVIRANSPWPVEVLCLGPDATRQTIRPGGSARLWLKPGRYEVGARVGEPGVAPLRGVHTYAAGKRYELRLVFRTAEPPEVPPISIPRQQIPELPPYPFLF